MALIDSTYPVQVTPQETLTVAQLRDTPHLYLFLLYPIFKKNTIVKFEANAKKGLRVSTVSYTFYPLRKQGSTKIFTGQENFPQEVLEVLDYRVDEEAAFTLPLNIEIDVTSPESKSIVWNLIWLLKHPEVAMSKQVCDLSPLSYKTYAVFTAEENKEEVLEMTRDYNFKTILLGAAKEVNKLRLVAHYLGIKGLDNATYETTAITIKKAIQDSPKQIDKFCAVWEADNFDQIALVVLANQGYLLKMDASLSKYRFDGVSFGDTLEQCVDKLIDCMETDPNLYHKFHQAVLDKYPDYVAKIGNKRAAPAPKLSPEQVEKSESQAASFSPSAKEDEEVVEKAEKENSDKVENSRTKPGSSTSSGLPVKSA